MYTRNVFQIQFSTSAFVFCISVTIIKYLTLFCMVLRDVTEINELKEAIDCN